MEIAFIREYIALAGMLNYTKAAEALFITQPTLSKHIRALETEIGVKLFDRTKHSVELTSIGKRVNEYFKKMMVTYNCLESELSQLKKEYSSLSIGMLYYGAEKDFHPSLKRFQESYPNVQLTILSCQPYQIRNMLEDGTIDMGTMLHSRLSNYDERYAYYHIKRKPLYALVLQDHPFAKQEFVSLQQLAQSKIIMTEVEKEHEKYIITLFRYHDLYLDDFIYTQQIDTLVMTMNETNGIYISCDSLDTLSPGNIKLVAISSSDFNVDLCYVSRKDNCNPYVLSMLESCNASVNDKNFTK